MNVFVYKLKLHSLPEALHKNRKYIKLGINKMYIFVFLIVITNVKLFVMLWTE